MTITAIVDDYCPRRGLRGEHGLSLLLEARGLKLLFDTGQSEIFLENTRSLGIDLSDLDAVVVSHGHYDHGGGLAGLYTRLDGSLPQLYAGSGFDAPRRSKSESGLKDIGLALNEVLAHIPKPVIVQSLQELAAGVYLLPHAELIDGTAPNPRFRTLHGDVDVIDDFEDELSLVIDGDDGVSIITGCAHRGIVNIVRSAMCSFPGKAVKAIVGGFHFVDMSPETHENTALAVAALSPAKVYCSHCTGLPGFAVLSAAMPGKVSWLPCGMSISL